MVCPLWKGEIELVVAIPKDVHLQIGAERGGYASSISPVPSSQGTAGTVSAMWASRYPGEC